MGFTLLLLSDPEIPESLTATDEWPSRLATEMPDIKLFIAASPAEAEDSIADIDAAFGYLPPALFAKATNLRWLASPRAGPDPSFYHQAMVDSDVQVTNVRGIYNDHISAQVMAYLLAFARGLPRYWAQQRENLWQGGVPTVYLPEMTLLIVGVGGIGAETARLAASFGIKVIGVDARREAPPPGLSELHGPDALTTLLPHADAVVLTVPETPATQGFFDAAKFDLMKPSAFFINIGRGATVRLDDLDRALRGGVIAAAALDVFETEPLPRHHPLWEAPGMLITPHVAAAGPYIDERRWQVFLDNCRRFDDGRPLANLVDKANWF